MRLSSRGSPLQRREPVNALCVSWLGGTTLHSRGKTHGHKLSYARQERPRRTSRHRNSTPLLGRIFLTDGWTGPEKTSDYAGRVRDGVDPIRGIEDGLSDGSGSDGNCSLSRARRRHAWESQRQSQWWVSRNPQFYGRLTIGPRGRSAACRFWRRLCSCPHLASSSNAGRNVRP